MVQCLDLGWSGVRSSFGWVSVAASARVICSDASVFQASSLNTPHGTEFSIFFLPGLL